MVEGTAGEGHATGQRWGCPTGSRPSSRCCTRTAAGKHEYTSASVRSRRGTPIGASAAASRAPPSPATRRSRRRAVRVTAREQCRATCGKSQRSGGTPASPARPAEQIRRADGLVDRPLAGVPAGCRGRPAGGCAGRARRSRSAVRGAAKAASGLRLGHVVEAGPQRGDLVALAGRVLQALGGAERVLDQGVLLHRRQDDAGRALDGCDEVGWAGHDLVGRDPGRRLGLGAPGAGPGAGLAARPRRPLALAGAMAARVWLTISCCDTPISKSAVRAPGEPDAPGHRARRVRRATTSLGHRDGVDRSQEPGAPASSAAARPPRSSGRSTRRASWAAPSPTRTGRRGRGSERCGHGGRCYGPAMATGDAGRWEAALEDYTKE